MSYPVNLESNPMRANEDISFTHTKMVMASLPKATSIDYKETDEKIPKKRVCCSFQKPKLNGDIPKTRGCCSFKKPEINGKMPKTSVFCCSMNLKRTKVPVELD